MADRVCPKCGSRYWVNSHHIPVRDTDSEDCHVCGETLLSWRKSTTIYSLELKERHENHLKKSQ